MISGKETKLAVYLVIVSGRILPTLLIQLDCDWNILYRSKLTMAHVVRKKKKYANYCHFLGSDKVNVL